MAVDQAVAEADDRLGRGHVVAGMVDAGLSSLATLLTGLFAARALEPAYLGAYALAFAGFALAAIVPDQVIFTPLEVAVVPVRRRDRLRLLPRTLRLGFFPSLLPALALPLWALVAPAEIPGDVVFALTVTAVACTFLSPVQDHVRRMLHVAGESWRAALVSLVQLLVAAAGVATFLVLDIPPWWGPFGILALANLLSLAGGLALALPRRHEAAVPQPWHVPTLVRSGGHLLLIGLVPTGAAFVTSTLVAHLAGPEMLGYAEVARICAQPLAVLTLGLSVTLGPRIVAAVRARDAGTAARIGRGFAALVLASGGIYLAVASFHWWGNPLGWLLPRAYEISGLVAFTIVGVVLSGIASPLRYALMAERREPEMLHVETYANLLRVLVGGAAGLFGAYVLPGGIIAVGAVRIVGYRRALRRAGRPRPSVPADTPAHVGANAHPAERVSPAGDATYGGDGGSMPENGRRLRVAVLVRDEPQPRWIADLVTDVATLPFCEVEAIVLRTVPHDDARRDPIRRAESAGWLFSLYNALDRAIFASDPDPLAPLPTAELLRGVRALHLTPRDGVGGFDFAAPDMRALLDRSFDVALHFGGAAPIGGALGVATHGIWSLRHGGVSPDSPELPGFAEVMTKSSVTDAALLLLGVPHGSPAVLRRAHWRTEKLSAYRNRSLTARKSGQLVLRALRELRLRGAVVPVEGESASPRDAEPRTNARMTRSLSRLALEYVRRRVTRARWGGGWFVAYSLRPGEAARVAAGGSPHGYRRLAAPADRFWADPFACVHDGRRYIFVEEYVPRLRRAHIAVIEIDPDGEPSPAVPVLERDHHVSYPCVFEWRGVHYMLPETLAAGRVELYRATAFPHSWTLHAVLLEGVRAVDPTIVEVDGRWWLFANVAQPRASDATEWSEELHLFYAASPLGPWAPHPLNPVKSDVRSSRPGGNLFWVGEVLYRPAQDCSERYGHAIRINRIVRLDLEHFEETPAATIEPRWAPGLIGTHTINFSGTLSVVDGRVGYFRARWRPP